MTEKTDDPAEVQQPMSNQQLLATLKLPSVYVNRFGLMMNGPLTKLTFSEQVTPDADSAEPRCAVVMDSNTAKVLRDVLSRFIARAEQQ